MPEVKIRGISEETLLKLTREAKKKGMPREEFLRKLLENFSVAPALLEQEEKYKTLLNMIAEILTLHTQAINDLENTMKKFFLEGENQL